MIKTVVDLNNDVTVETYNTPVNIAWIEDRVEVYWDHFTIHYNDVTTEDQAKQIYFKFNFAWVVE